MFLVDFTVKIQTDILIVLLLKSEKMMVLVPVAPAGTVLTDGRQ